MNHSNPAELVFDNPDLRAMILEQKTYMEVESIKKGLLERRIKHVIQENKKAFSKSWNRKKKNTKNNDAAASTYHQIHSYNNRPKKIGIPCMVDDLERDEMCYRYSVFFKTYRGWRVERWESAPVNARVYWYIDDKKSHLYEEYIIEKYRVKRPKMENICFVSLENIIIW